MGCEAKADRFESYLRSHSFQQLTAMDPRSVLPSGYHFAFFLPFSRHQIDKSYDMSFMDYELTSEVWP
jgi:hypothetical protein